MAWCEEKVPGNANMRSGVASESAACPHTDRRSPHSHSPSVLRKRVPVPAPYLDSSADMSTGAGLVHSPVDRRAAVAAGPASWDRPATGRTRTTMPAAAAVVPGLQLPARASRSGRSAIVTHNKRVQRQTNQNQFRTAAISVCATV